MKKGLVVLAVMAAVGVVCTGVMWAQAIWTGSSTASGGGTHSTGLSGQYYIAMASPPMRASDPDHAHLGALYAAADVDIISGDLVWGGNLGVDKTPSTYPTSGSVVLDFTGYDGYFQQMVDAGKKIGIFIQGITYNSNTFVPDYVFSTAWATQAGVISGQRSDPLYTCTCTNYNGGLTENVTAASENGTTVTLTLGAPLATFAVGRKITVAGVSVAGYNGTWVITGGTATQPTYTASASGLGAGSGGTAVPVQCSQPGVAGDHHGMPAMWMPAYYVAYRDNFVRYVLNHYGPNCNTGLAGGCAASAIRNAVFYVRFGTGVGCEMNLSCYSGNNGAASDATQLPAPYTFSTATNGPYQNYLAMMDETVTALPHAGMLLETSFTQLNFDSSYALDAAVVESHVAHGMGTGVQSLQAADISGYNENPTSMGSCSGAWCYFFDQHDQKAATAERAPFYHLQLFACSNPTSTPCTPGDPLGKTGTAVNLISFARQRMNAPINILEFWPQDIALWADPNYCVKGTPDDGTCHAGSMSNAHYEYLAYRDAYAATFRDFRK